MTVEKNEIYQMLMSLLNLEAQGQEDFSESRRGPLIIDLARELREKKVLGEALSTLPENLRSILFFKTEVYRKAIFRDLPLMQSALEGFEPEDRFKIVGRMYEATVGGFTTLLHEAANWRRNLPLIPGLLKGLEQEAQINWSIMSDGRKDCGLDNALTPLQLAIRHENVELFDALLEGLTPENKERAVNSPSTRKLLGQDIQGRTALEYAAFMYHHGDVSNHKISQAMFKKVQQVAGSGVVVGRKPPPRDKWERGGSPYYG